MKRSGCHVIIMSLMMILFSLFGGLQVCSAQSNPKTEASATSTFVVSTNSTHFWVNNNLWLSKNATYTIQSAFDNLPAQGGKVFLKAGVYPVNGIYITNKGGLNDSPYQQIIFEGEGRQVATLKLNDNAKGASSKLESFPDYANKAVIWCEPCTVESGLRFTITNIGIDGNRKNQQTEIAGIAIYNDWDSIIEDNYLFECGGHGIIHLGSRWLRTAYITGNYVYFTDMSGQNPANPSSPVENYLSGILSWRTDVAIRENTVGWTGYRGESSFLGIGISASFALVDNNWVWGNYLGVLISNGQFFSLTGNFIENNVNGIHLWNAHCGTIQSNDIRISCNPDTGIKIGGNSSYNSIKLNKIWVRDNLTAQYGIRETDTADYNIINDNTIIGKSKTFFSESNTNSVGYILTAIATTGAHSTVSGNNVDQEETSSSSKSQNLTITPEPTTTIIPTDSDLHYQMPKLSTSECSVGVLLVLLVAGTMITLVKTKNAETPFKQP